MTNYFVNAGDYLLDIAPYFFGALAIAFVLAVVSVWWSRGLFMKVVALAALGLMVWFVFFAASKTNDQINYTVKKANEQIDFLLSSLLSKPKPITFKDLQDMLPEGHPGHLVLYGEAKSGGGIYLLLRSPGVSEPRYYLMVADKELQGQFKDAEFEAKKKKTQLFLGGKKKSGKKKSDGAGKDRNQNRKNDLPRKGEAGHGTQKSEGGLGVFHPAPVTEDGPSKSD